MQLSNYIGKSILLSAPLLRDSDTGKVTLLAVEAGGIWVECDELSAVAIEAAGPPPPAATPVFFVPYASMHFALVWEKNPQ
jgi:hypothetical protein